MTAIHPVAVKLDVEVRARIQALAKAQDRTPHYLMREAINQYVEREEKRAAFRQDALQAWENYQESGQHVAHADAVRWMADLEAGRDVDPLNARVNLDA